MRLADALVFSVVCRLCRLASAVPRPMFPLLEKLYREIYGAVGACALRLYRATLRPDVLLIVKSSCSVGPNRCY